MKKPFMEVFPTLQLREELKSVLEFVSIDRITMNRDRDFMRIYLESDKLIVKSCIFELEQAITGQLFSGCQNDSQGHRAFSSFQAVYAAEPDADL